MENEQFIHDYENGNLSAQDRAVFENRLNTEPTFAQEVKDFRDLKIAIKSVEKNTLKERLQQLESQNIEESPSSKQDITYGKRYRHIYAAAAVIIFAIVMFQFLEKDPTSQDLYASYYQAPPNTLQPVIRGNDSKDQLSLAFQAYEAQEYGSAATLFKAALEQEYNPDVRFYRAMSLISNGQEALGNDILQELKKEDTSFAPQVFWYSALIALKNNEQERAKQQLDSLGLLDSGYKEKTIRRLKKELND